MKKISLLAILVICLVPFTAQAALHHGIEDPSDMQIEAKMEPAWRACAKSEECDVINYGCAGHIAANTKHFAEATDIAHKIGGDPAQMKCPSKPGPDYAPSCQDKLCVATILNE